MSGHSKWAQIKRQKGLTDQKRANVFTKLARFITVAVKESGGIEDPAMNFKLRLAIEKARQSNMPKVNIDRAIELGNGKAGGAAMEAGMYEGYGPGGIAVMVETVSDNPVRTYQDIRYIFDRNGGTLGQVGSVGFMFDHMGRITVKGEFSEESQLQLMDIVGVMDLEARDDEVVIFCASKDVKQIQDKLAEQKISVEEASLVMRPKQPIAIEENLVERIGNFIEALEESDDVQQVYTNVDAQYV